jgi:type IV secretory pathway VirB3-like protein
MIFGVRYEFQMLNTMHIIIIIIIIIIIKDVGM